MKAMFDGVLQAEPVMDDFQAGEVLPDQVGTEGISTFTFSSPVNLVVIDASGAETDVARADPFGGMPTQSLGIPCRNETPTFLPVITTQVRVWAPDGMVMSVYGYRRVS